jgi:hypothetical protein
MMDNVKVKKHDVGLGAAQSSSDPRSAGGHVDGEDVVEVLGE